MCINLLLKISFFKNFDNNDFIVKVIFCFQPILAIKNDILIKDGDFIEDIIFNICKKREINIRTFNKNKRRRRKYKLK